jgi:hypothetical protein
VSKAALDGRHGEVWVSVDGRLVPTPVGIGISDGSYTAVLGGPLSEGAQVVTGITMPSGTSGTSTSPLLPFGGRRPGGSRGAARPPGA